MLFSRYRKLSSCPTGTPQLYNTSVDNGHAPLTALEVSVTLFGPALMQVGAYDGSTFSPYFTQGLSAERYPQTLECSFPHFVSDGSQQVGVSVTNLDIEARDIYLDMVGTEA